MQYDDHQLGYLLSRREAVTLLGAAGYSLLGGCTSTKGQQAAAGIPGCVVRPEQTQGPYFVDERLNRSDIRVDPTDGVLTPGAPLDLTIVVSRLAGNGCAPLPGVLVDVWHCDHLGVYSDVEDPGFNTIGKKFLRGYQATDSEGNARFTTIYPGWYAGRTVHVHFKIRSAPTARPGFAFTSQVYFDDALTDLVQAQEPYAVKGVRTVRNEQDGIYRRGGSQLVLALTPNKAGYAGTFQVALQIA
jgi:protocatechuate 3,4-dioxygenase beta subunit